MTLEANIPYVDLTMRRPHLHRIPHASLPAPYSIRAYRAGDEAHWARIEHAVGEFATPEAALRRFEEEFGPHTADMEKRCLFVCDGQGTPIGTTTAWYGELDGAALGRIHWVAVVPEHQGNKLAKPLLSAALEVMARYHDEAYLTTQTTSYKAVGMYLNYGFEPVYREPACAEGWELINRLLGRRENGAEAKPT
ncbi:GNAT family N-acetyltransferase [Paenibacillus hodogayensis]|uniref:GNAT family N-acetyltransferase n=1 Tax=Paenibacillus hodogayensis TaxID=279208 RepID=A0ABV5W2Q6_9BACL